MRLKIKPLLLVFYLPFLFLLVLYIAFDHLLVQADGVNKVAPGPKMVVPPGCRLIGLLFQLRVALE